MPNNFAKLISEKEYLMLLEGKIEKQKLIEEFLNPVFQKLLELLSDDILMAKLIKPHIYRFHIQLHAQEQEKDTK